MSNFENGPLVKRFNLFYTVVPEIRMFWDMKSNIQKFIPRHTIKIEIKIFMRFSDDC